MAYWVGKGATRDRDKEDKTREVPDDRNRETDKPGPGKPDNCEQKCQALYDKLIERGGTPEQAQQRKQNCLNRCYGDDDDDDDDDKPCVTNADCPEGQRCKNGVCVDRPGDCPKGDYYTSTVDCEDGYVWFPGKQRCECSAWCLTVGYEADCKTPKGGPKPDDMGEFQFPEGLKEYYDMMMARGKELLGMPVGYTDEMINKMYGKDFEAIRGQEAAQREATSRVLSREGALGTGQATQAFTNIGMGTEQNIASALRDIFIESEKQKKTDILNYTEMAQNLFAGGQNYWMLQEAANAARRGDMFKSLELLLKYYGIGVAGYGG